MARDVECIESFGLLTNESSKPLPNGQEVRSRFTRGGGALEEGAKAHLELDLPGVCHGVRGGASGARHS